MRLHRFYVLQPLGEGVVIDDVSLINQWTKVFRYEVGDFVILFNGDGYDYCYSLSSLSKKTCSLTYTKKDVSIIPKKKVTLCLSLIKKDNFELVVQKATELGVTCIIPVLSSRSEKKNLSYERLAKISMEAAEQCGRGNIPTILPVTTLKDTLSMLSPEKEGFILSIDGSSLVTKKSELKDKESFLFVGPEGGWGPEDLSLIETHSLSRYSLGETVLRAETAAIVATAIITI